MKRGSLIVAAIATALLLSGSALGDSSQSVTATGDGFAKVRPKNRHSEASIEAAVEAAQKAAIPLAVRDARSHALEYANAAGLTLGPVISVSDIASNGFYGPGLWGPFGPTQFCGAGSQPPIPAFGAAKRKGKAKRVQRCFVPPLESTTLTVIFAAGPSASGRAKSVTATGVGVVTVHPKNRHSEASIEAAVAAAEKAAVPLAVDDAHQYGLLYARAAGLTLGATSSVSDAIGIGYGPGYFGGPFGPNRFCGKIGQPIIKVRHGRKRLVGFKRVRRCFVPPVEVTTLTVTYSAS